MKPPHRITIIAGDGIGPEVISAAVEVLEATRVPFEFVEAQAGFETFCERGVALPEETLEEVSRSSATLFGAVSSPSKRVEGYRSPIVDLRRELELYACLRPVRSPAGAEKAVDLVVIRENTEGLYWGRETRDGNRAFATRLVSIEASRRIAEFALDYAKKQGRDQLTIVHKANVLRETCGLFRETVRETLAGHVEIGEELVDAAAYKLVANPEQFDLILTTNLFGDILSDVAAHWAGGLGVVASANIGARNAVFEPVHGSAPDLAGKGIANPMAAFEAAAMMLDYLGENDAAKGLRRARESVWREGPKTPDLGGKATLSEVTQAMVDRLRGQVERT